MLSGILLVFSFVLAVIAALGARVVRGVDLFIVAFALFVLAEVLGVAAHFIH